MPLAHQVLETSSFIYIVTEYAQNGEIFDFLGIHFTVLYITFSILDLIVIVLFPFPLNLIEKLM